MNGKKLVPCKSVKYLGVFIDCFLNWSTHLTSLSKKLSRATGMLSKIRHYVDWNTLHMVYFGILIISEISNLIYIRHILGKTIFIFDMFIIIRRVI